MQYEFDFFEDRTGDLSSLTLIDAREGIECSAVHLIEGEWNFVYTNPSNHCSPCLSADPSESQHLTESAHVRLRQYETGCRTEAQGEKTLYGTDI